MYLKQIIITHTFEGFHRWRGAPDEVAFLANLHRHLFHVKVGLEVLHNDRDSEFFTEKKILQKVLQKFIEEFECFFSCEDVAEYILKQTPYAYWAEVWEDEENGARVERVKQIRNY